MRIRAIREAKGIGQKELAQRMNVVSSYISQLERDRTKSPGKDVLERVSAALGVSVGELLGELDAPGLAVGPIRKIPLLDWICAGDGKEAVESGHPGHAEEYIETDLAAPRLFALRVQGDSMEPLFRAGEVILINPDLEAIPGDYCVAKLENEAEATLKQLQKVGTVYFLHPLNPAYENIPVTKKVRIVGKVVRSQRDW